MDGKYLASKIGPLKVLGDGNVLKTLNDIINERNESRRPESHGELVAYEIKNAGSAVTDIYFLIKNQYGLHFRYFNLYSDNSVDDGISKTAKYGFGLHDVLLKYFIELRDFYFERSYNQVAEIS